MSKAPQLTPPHNAEVEATLVGALLLQPEAVHSVSALVRPCDFYIVKIGWVYEAILSLQRLHEPVDFITVCNQLEKMGRLGEIGGSGYVSSMISGVPSALHAEAYAGIVKATATRRRILDIASEAARMAYDESQPVGDVLDSFETQVYQLRADHSGPTRVRHVQDIADQVWNDLSAAASGETAPSFSTGYPDLDRILGGLRRGTLSILGARPGVGKTAWLLNVSDSDAARDLGVLFFSLEMTAEGLMHRLITSQSGISLTRLSTADLNDDDWKTLPSVLGDLSQKSVWVDDTPSISLPELRARTLRLATKYPISLILVDYVQLATMGQRYDKRYREVGDIAKGLKALAKEMDAAVILASQLSRAVEQREDKRPILSDLRESGDLEQHADVVIFIYRDCDKKGPQPADLIVAKHRYGPTGVATVQWQPERVRFVSLARESSMLGA